MIVFDFSKVITSSFSALLYGAIFAFLYVFALLISSIIRLLFALILSPQICENATKRDELLLRIKSPTLFLKMLSIFIFGIGFTLLSYLTLDGMIRFYMIALSVSAFLLAKQFFFQNASSFLLSIFSNITVRFAKLLSSIPKFRKKHSKNAPKNQIILRK